MEEASAAERAAKIRHLFEDTLGLDHDRRQARLASNFDDDIRRAVERLLAAADEADAVLAPLEALFPAASREARHPLVGRVVSHFHVTSYLGGGGMGVVYRAVDTRLDRAVALKFLPADLTRDPEARERFVQEAKAASALDNPHICNIHEIGETDDGQTFIAMACYEGETLQQVLARGPLSEEDALRCAAQLTEALAAAHAGGIIHRDVKPANVMITTEGAVKLLDFGLAKLSDVKLTHAGATLGTAAYMSPEQAAGGEVDHRTDLWSLGVVLYEMLTGERPFPGEHEQAVLHAVLDVDPRPVRTLRPEIRPAVAAIVERLLAKNPSERYATAGDVREALARASATSGPALAAQTPARRRRLWPVVAVVAGLAILAFIAVQLVRAPAAVRTGTDRPSVAVMYFENQTSEAQLERILVGLLTTNLGRYEDLQVVSSQRLFDILKRLGKENVAYVTREVASDVAEAARVKTMVLGSIIQLGNRIRITAELVDARTGDILATEHQTGARVEDVFEMVDQLTFQLASHLTGVSAGVTLGVADVTTESYEAYREYQLAMERWYRFDALGARDHFEAAVTIDSTFAIAHAMLGEMRMWEAVHVVSSWSASLAARRDLERARRHATHATERERLHIEAIYHLAFGEDSLALESVDGLVARFPDDVYALERAVAWNRGFGDPQKQARYLRDLVARDPASGNALNHLAYFVAAEGDYDGGIAEARRYVALQPDIENAYDTLWEIYVRAGRLQEAYQAALEGLEKNPRWTQLHLLAGQSRLLQGRIIQAVAHLTAATDYHITRMWGGPPENLALVYQGRLREAADAFDAALIGVERDEQMLLLWQKGQIQAERGEHRAAQATYDEAIRLIPDDDHLALPRRIRIAYSAGRACLMAHDDGCLARRRRYISGLAETLDDPVHRAHSPMLEVERLIQEGDLAAALRLLERGTFVRRRVLWDQDSRLHAMVDERAGALEKALAYWQRVSRGIGSSRREGDFLDWHLEGARYDYRLGTLYEQMGDVAKAIEHYRRQLERWKAADPDLPRLLDLRERLARLEGHMEATSAR